MFAGRGILIKNKSKKIHFGKKKTKRTKKKPYLSGRVYGLFQSPWGFC
jgi:hypothetical protein